MMRLIIIPFLLLALTGCQTTDPAPAASDGSLARLYDVQATAGAMQVAELDPTGLAKTAVMMENHRRMQAVSDDIPKIMEGHRQRAIAFCKGPQAIPECRQLLADLTQARPK
ncbi:hypothetical protein BoBH3_09630 [Bosea sp. BH3]|nr:hypothetical protein [Bosea sp. BH3]